MRSAIARLGAQRMGRFAAHAQQPVRSFSVLSGEGAMWAEDQYTKWLKDPKSVHPSWDLYFQGGCGEKDYPRGGMPGASSSGGVISAPAPAGSSACDGEFARGATVSADLVRTLPLIRSFQVFLAFATPSVSVSCCIVFRYCLLARVCSFSIG